MPNLLAPAFAALTAAVSAVIASDGGLMGGADEVDVLHLSKSDAVVHAERVFDRADIDGSGALEADEFAALSIVTAELAHLNGYVTIETDAQPREVALPITAPSALSYGERARVEAVARNEFYVAAGGDGLLSKAEFVDAQLLAFNDADRNRNGVLKPRELSTYAIKQASLSVSV